MSIKHKIIIHLIVLPAMFCLSYAIIWNFDYKSAYKNGWNDCHDAIPKAIIFNASSKVYKISQDIKEGKIDKNHIALDIDGNPAFVCMRPGVSSEYVDGGEFIDLAQIFPGRR